ncbi:putative Sec8 exocyst complex component specific domain, exocyst complex component Sec8/EXOC4 [Septoria linicola]|nr:putative Sec8 exocyst complex component specific domain, exocyst complex component Sec8/EXOC4 [Septoria linicola]
MSSFRTNGYLNGGEAALNRFNFDDSSRDTSDAERSRSRGAPPPRGFQTGASRVQGTSRLDRGHAQRRGRDYGYGYDQSQSRSRSRVSPRYGQAGGQIEDVLRFIEQQWAFMANDSCIPVKVALQLMDNSSLGLADQYQQFGEAHTQLQNALKVIVNEHHQGFNSSIGTFHKIQAAIQSSQFRVRTLRAGLVQAKSSLATGRPELKAFAHSSQSYDQMLQVLGTIEQLQQVPEKLEAQISEKRFLGAVDILQDALKLMRKPEMEEIGALSDLKVYLSNQEHSLTDILIEELHNHLYLKSPYCEERWKAHTRRDPTSTTIDDNERAMFEFLETFDATKPMLEDTTRNPEADTFYYIQLLLESLNRMNRLESAVDAIEHRLPVELFTVVERSHMEVEQRHPAVMRAVAKVQRNAMGITWGADGERKETLEDLLTTLFAKYEAIAEGHRVLHDVTAAIIRRDDHDESAGLNRSFRELWKLLQSEIRSLLHDHLATNGNLGQRMRQDNDPNMNIFKPQPRDKSRKLFKLSETDHKSPELATERDDLEAILKQSVPGLVGSNAQNAKQDRDTVTDISATGHKLLVEPSVFNMGILLKPSLDFLTRLREVVPPQSGVVPSTLTSFLDDFLINVFYPQLDETLLDLCSRSMTEMDAFQADPKWQVHAQRPIFKGTARFYELIEAFCVMLDSLPHDQSFSQLIVTQMRTYYDKCYQWSKSLLQRALTENGNAKMRLAAHLATDGEVNKVVIELSKRNVSDPIVLAEKETALLLRQIKNTRLEEADLIVDRKAIAALCTLHTSMKWLAAQCKQLRYISPRAIDTSSMQAHDRRRWTQIANVGSAPTGPYLPLDQQTAAGFDAVIASFTELSSLILRTLHVDLRLHLLHGIYAALDTTYALGQPYNDPDPAILNLSTSLGTYDSAISANLLPPQYDFLTANLHVLANNALVSLVGCVQALDEHGIDRMGLNVLVLQQTLKTAMQQDASLEYAARFYEMRDPATIAAEGIKRGYAPEDLKTLARLVWVQDRDRASGNGTLDELVASIA